LLTIFAVPFMAGIGFGFFALGLSVPLATLIAILAQGVLAAVFYRLLKAPTLAGGKVRDEIDGFKMFLDTAEKDRLEKLNPPHVTPEIFEKFLPYAIALDAEDAFRGPSRACRRGPWRARLYAELVFWLVLRAAWHDGLCHLDRRGGGRCYRGSGNRTGDFVGLWWRRFVGWRWWRRLVKSQ
jgi:hypothetical protein